MTEKELDDLLVMLQGVDLADEDQLLIAKILVFEKRKTWRGSRIDDEVRKQLLKINAALETCMQLRGLVERLDAGEASLTGNPTLEELGKHYVALRDVELALFAGHVGGKAKERHARILETVRFRYVDGLRTAARDAVLATTGAELAPFGKLEDLLQGEVAAATLSNDKQTISQYSPMLQRTRSQIDGLVTRLFDEAYQSRVPWHDLLADADGWTVVSSPSFQHTFGADLKLANAAGDQSSSGGLAYTPGDKWRDYVLEVELELDSGTLVFYTRVGDKMDSKEVPAFSLGTEKSPNILIEHGKVYSLVITLIGNRMTVTGEGITPYTENIAFPKSRRGEPGIVAREGTKATITRLRARHLRS